MKGTTVFWEHGSPSFPCGATASQPRGCNPVVVLQAAVGSIRSASGAAGHGGQGKMARITPGLWQNPIPAHQMALTTSDLCEHGRLCARQAVVASMSGGEAAAAAKVEEPQSTQQT